jgi:hypothetical protein
MSKPSNISPVQWDQAFGLARQACARIFRDGGSPSDALSLYGLTAPAKPPTWDRAIAMIAESQCAANRPTAVRSRAA